MAKSVLIFFAEKVNGRLVLDTDGMAEQLAQLADGPLEFQVTRLGAEPSSRQMQNYFHAVPVEICARHFGMQHDAMRYALMGEWRGYRDTPFGTQVPNCSSERRLTRDDWTDLISWVLEWGPSEHGLFIPEPNAAQSKQMMEAFSHGRRPT